VFHLDYSQVNGSRMRAPRIVRQRDLSSERTMGPRGHFDEPNGGVG
jgi:hypothetical protein